MDRIDSARERATRPGRILPVGLGVVIGFAAGVVVGGLLGEAPDHRASPGSGGRTPAAIPSSDPLASSATESDPAVSEDSPPTVALAGVRVHEWPAAARGAELRRLLVAIGDGDDTALVKRMTEVAWALDPRNGRHRGAGLDRTLVVRLLEHPCGGVRRCGFLLSMDRALAAIPVLVRLAREESDDGLRAFAVAALGIIHAGDPSAIEALLAAADDGSYQVRLAAVIAFGRIGEPGPAVQAGLRAALQDPHIRVREEALRRVGLLPEGAALALDVLRSGGVDAELAPDLLGAVVEGGRLRDAIEEDPSDDLIALIATTVAWGGIDELEPADVAALRGRLPAILDACRRVDPQAIGTVLFLAREVGAGEWLRSTARAGEAPWPLRHGAIEALLKDESTWSDGVAIAAGLLTDPRTPPRWRTALLEVVWNSGEPPLDLFRRVAREDPNPWVRDEAQRRLDSR